MQYYFNSVAKSLPSWMNFTSLATKHSIQHAPSRHCLPNNPQSVYISLFDMISRREKLLIHPWEVQRYENHRKKVINAKAAIDDGTPPVYPHVMTKLKKAQAEKDRLKRIEKENVRLLQKLGNIMSSKRLENFWMEPRPNFLNREKLFETRPKTSKTAIETTRTSRSDTPEFLASGSSRRCMSCSGRPIQRVEKIPEERIPWEPPRRTSNIRDMECYHLKKCCNCHNFL